MIYQLLITSTSVESIATSIATFDTYEEAEFAYARIIDQAQSSMLRMNREVMRLYKTQSAVKYSEE